MLYFTADQHYGSSRHITLSKRPFLHVEELTAEDIENDRYWKKMVPDVKAQDEYIIKCHNEVVEKGDIVINVGDFGDWEILKHLNGTHYLIFGNYEEEELKKKWNNDIVSFRNFLIRDVGFQGIFTKSFTIPISDSKSATSQDVMVNITHKPEDCIKDQMNIFGHIHEKCKIKRYGVNCGVDANHFYPISADDVYFYINAIKNHYDDNVFE